MARSLRLLSILAFVLLLPLASPALPLLGSSQALAASAVEIDAKVKEAMAQLYKESSAAKELGGKAHGILCFPSITKGGFIIGGEFGEGSLLVGEETKGYYNSASGSLGLQIGISSRSLVIMFMTEDALKEFMGADGWEAGVDADVTVVEAGATGSLDSTTAEKPVIGFNFGEAGLMAGVSIEGTKVTEIEPD